MYSRGLVMDYLKRKIDKFLDEWLISDKRNHLLLKVRDKLVKPKQ